NGRRPSWPSRLREGGPMARPSSRISGVVGAPQPREADHPHGVMRPSASAQILLSRSADRIGGSVPGCPAQGPGGEYRPSMKGAMTMAIGPVQLLVLGFSQPKFHGEIIAELERLRESDLVRVIDSLAVYKDADGELEVEHLSNLSKDEAIELGSKIGALIGLGFEGEEGAEAGALAGAE